MNDKDLTEEEKLDIVREIHEVDACEYCFGARGGVPGNENIIKENDGTEKVICDYCHSDMITKMIEDTSDTVKSTGSTIDTQFANTLRWRQMGR